MKRIIIKNSNGIQTHGADMLDPSEWITRAVDNNAWGLPERWIKLDLATPSELEKKIEERTVVDYQATEAVLDDSGNVLFPASPEVSHVEIKLPSEYTITIIDVTAEYHQKEIDAYIKERNEKADNDIQSLLGNQQDTTHLMLSMYDQVIANNTLGTATADEIAAAKTRISDAIELMKKIQAIRSQRDADIEAYLAAHPIE